MVWIIINLDCVRVFIYYFSLEVEIDKLVVEIKVFIWIS